MINFARLFDAFATVHTPPIILGDSLDEHTLRSFYRGPIHDQINMGRYFRKAIGDLGLPQAEDPLAGFSSDEIESLVAIARNIRLLQEAETADQSVANSAKGV